MQGQTAFAPEVELDIRVELALNEQTLVSNDYPQDRGIFKRGAVDNFSHFDFFGETYVQRLQNLAEDDLFIDVGPGDFFAEVEYFSARCFRTHANVLANAYCLSSSPAAKRNLELLEGYRRRGKFTCIDGIKFQQLKWTLKRPANLIADVFAAGSYDPDLFGVFNAASKILVPGGIFAVVLAGVQFRSESGTRISPLEIYKKLQGYEVIHRAPAFGWIFRRNEHPFSAPPAELTSFVARNSDQRIFWPRRQYRIGSHT